MHPLYEKANALSKEVYLAAIEGDRVDMDKFKAQTLTYLKLADLPLGMVINFGSDGFGKRGIHRVILKGASNSEGNPEPERSI